MLVVNIWEACITGLRNWRSQHAITGLHITHSLCDFLPAKEQWHHTNVVHTHTHAPPFSPPPPPIHWHHSQIETSCLCVRVKTTCVKHPKYSDSRFFPVSCVLTSGPAASWKERAGSCFSPVSVPLVSTLASVHRVAYVSLSVWLHLRHDWMKT